MTGEASPVDLRADLVAQLAALLDSADPLRIKLEREVEHERSIVALSTEERIAIVGLLTSNPPEGLLPLRTELAKQLKQARVRSDRANALKHKRH